MIVCARGLSVYVQYRNNEKQCPDAVNEKINSLVK